MGKITTIHGAIYCASEGNKFENVLRQLTWKYAYAQLVLEWPPEGFTDKQYFILSTQLWF